MILFFGVEYLHASIRAIDDVVNHIPYCNSGLSRHEYIITRVSNLYWTYPRFPVRPGDEGSNGCHFAGVLAGSKGEMFQVSSQQKPFVAVLEDSLGDPLLAEGVTREFASHLNELKKSLNFSWLCFVEKEAGPVGAVCMTSALVTATGLPACVYRAGYWAQRAKVVGRQPARGTRIALVYDLIVSGKGIREVAHELRRTLGVSVVGAVVLYAYDGNDRIEADGEVIQVRALCSDRSLVAEIEKILEGAQETEHIKLLTNRRSLSSSVGGGRAFSDTKEEIMEKLTPQSQSDCPSEFEKERAAFLKMLPELLKTYPGWFVAIRDEKILDKDKDEFALGRRVCRPPHQEFILIERVEPNLDTPLQAGMPACVLEG